MADQFRLTPDEQRVLIDQAPQVQTIRDGIARLKRIGTIDTTDLEEAADRAERTRAGFLQEFGSRMVPRS